ncbi:putative alanine racemase-domain-containing protein, partial [Jimgerdemannia flammicorona]
IAAVLHNTPEIRAQLLKYIASAFGGDRLVAEFVLLQLLSRIHTRKGSLTLGNLTLNITHFPTPPAASATNPAIRPFASLLASLMPKYHDLSLTLAALNRAWFFPRSVDEVLKAGVLQLPEGTTIVVDETVLEEGVLGDQGFIFASGRGGRGFCNGPRSM